VSEGRDELVLAALRAAAGAPLLDLHADPSHHRAVLTMAGPTPALLRSVRELAETAITRIDLARHDGVHPRFGALDVVPFAPLREGSLGDAVDAREAALEVLGALGLPCFRYGPMRDGTLRTLPEVRRGAFSGIEPDAGPRTPHRTAGAVAVGAREPLVAWNAWMTGLSLPATRQLAASVRSEYVRALGFQVDGATQVSCNLLAPGRVTAADVAARLAMLLPRGARLEHCEVVGLVPSTALAAVPPEKWARLGLSKELDVEARFAARARTPTG
jgi:glutamate formiminotransferase